MTRISTPIVKWIELVTRPKFLFSWDAWTAAKPGTMTKAKAAKLGHQPYRSAVASRLSVLADLTDETGVSIEGLRLRIEVNAVRQMEDLVSTLEVLNENQWTCICRLDGRPTAPHGNTYWRQFGVPPTINGTHVHPVDLNGRLGMDAFAPLGNLPVAIAAENEPQSFRDFGAMIERTFAIHSVDPIGPPPWQEDML